MSAEHNIGTLRLDIDREMRRHGEIAPVALSCRMLTHILDEREALLLALRKTALVCEDAMLGRSPRKDADLRATYRLAWDTIEKAEAP